MNCIDVRARATDYLEGALSHQDHRAFERHLRVCALCRDWMDSFEGTIQALRELGEEAGDREADNRVIEAFRRWREREAEG